jgi:hypothetical protein
VIELCARYLDWQLEYFRGGHDGHGPRAFEAQRIRSTPGKEDGLFWPQGSRSGESPSGPRFASAAFGAQQPDGGPAPYFGYFFKTLVVRGKSATGAFAMVAWPAGYGATGRRSFVVSHAGEILSKDLGPGTPRAATGMGALRLDRSWTRLSREPAE